MNDVSIVGRPALLWRLERTGIGTMQCIAGELVDRRYCVRVLRDGSEEISDAFRDPGTGVRWALEMERSLIEAGWTKVA